jgi:hypothetical protein
MLEVFDGIGDKGSPTIDAGIVKCAIQNLACRTNERSPRAIFLVSGLLPDNHQIRSIGALARYSLGGVLVERAALALAFGRREILKWTIHAQVDVSRLSLPNANGAGLQWFSGATGPQKI